MERIVPVICETRNVRQSIMADRQSIAQAQAASQALHEELLALAHSAEMGIHQLQQELQLASAIKFLIEESNPSLRLDWPEFPQADLLAQGSREALGALTHPDHASAARGGRDGTEASGLFHACSQGVIDYPAAQLAASTCRPSGVQAQRAPSETGPLKASTVCRTNAAARAGLDTARPTRVHPARVHTAATAAPATHGSEAGHTATRRSSQGLATVVPAEPVAGGRHLPPKVALTMARAVPTTGRAPIPVIARKTLGNAPSRKASADRPVAPAPAVSDETVPVAAAAALVPLAPADTGRTSSLTAEAPADRPVAPAPAVSDETVPVAAAAALVPLAPADTGRTSKLDGGLKQVR